MAAILQHYARSLIFMKHFFSLHINFQNEKANTLTFLIILIVKRFQIELHGTNLLPWPQSASAGIKVRSLQSPTTPRRLTLLITHHHVTTNWCVLSLKSLMEKNHNSQSYSTFVETMAFFLRLPCIIFEIFSKIKTAKILNQNS